jgi:D-glycero-alpha-D-manno-heptose-7-phosphate kinase
MDLAGGTLDIYPLYLFEEFGITVNAAIDQGSDVLVEVRDDKIIHLRADDINVEQYAESLDELSLHGPLPLLARVAKWYLKDFDRGVNITTRNKAPKGSGLGASSCLIITLSGALNHLSGRVKPDPTHEDSLLYKYVEVASHLEAQLIAIPTGKQDYYPAAFGGVNALWFEPGGDRVERLGDGAQKELQDRIILSYTGESRFSGTSNWIMTRTYIDDDYGARDRLRGIKETAIKLREAIVKGDWDGFAECVAEEWENRRSLAAGVTTKKIDAIIESAEKAGALASKICGAGGGGCMITVIRPEDRQKVSAAIEAADGQVLQYAVQDGGLTVEEE